MDITKIKQPASMPEEIMVVIEIPANSDPIKYEFDKDSGMICVDRFMSVTMSYPCNYGFMPNSLSGDGDPLDVLVLSQFPIHPCSIIKVRPIGVLITEDESGDDEKLIAVPATKVDPSFADVKSINDLPKITVKKIAHFFERYKDLEEGKWVKVKEWKEAQSAKQVVLDAVKRFAK